jgi:hypothetical protein
MLAVAGVPISAIMDDTGPMEPDGMNILHALLANESSPREELVHNIDERSANAMHVSSIRVGNWKLIKGYPGCTTNGSDTPGNPSGTKGGCYNGVDFAWKPPEMTQPAFDVGVQFSSPAPCSVTPCLFNVKSDFGEEHDQAQAQPAILEKLLQRLRELQASEVSLEEAQLCLPANDIVDGCRANLGSGVWAPWLNRGSSEQQTRG